MKQKQKTTEFLEIVEKIPNKILLIITCLAAFIFCSLIFFAVNVSYPDVISGEGRLKISKNTIFINMPSSGKINLFIDPKERVQSNQILAVLQNEAKVEDVKRLKNKIEKWKNEKSKSNILEFTEAPKLGELKVAYTKLLNSVLTLDNYRNSNELSIKADNLRNKITRQRLHSKQLSNRLSTKKQELTIQKKKMHRDSILFFNQVISEANYETSKQIYFQYKQSFLKLLSTKNQSINKAKELEESLKQLIVQNKNLKTQTIIEVNSSYAVLSANIENWEKKYLIKSPIDGRIEFLNFLTENDFIEKNKKIFCVMGSSEDNYKFEVMLNASNSGKIKKNQDVIIRLHDYAYNEYGSIHGVVSNIFLTKVQSSNKTYTLLQVDLENQGKTDTDKTIEFVNGMTAQIDVVVERMNIAQRFLNRMNRLKKE